MSSPLKIMTDYVSLGEILAKYKTTRHFYEAYLASGKVVVDPDYISWNYVKEILTGSKLLINQKDVEGVVIPPK